MNRIKGLLWTGLVAVAAAAAPASSQAGTLSFDFNGPNVVGALTISFEPATAQGNLPSSPANAVNPIGSYTITGASGTFSDTASTLVPKIENAAVTGVAGLNRVAPEASNALAPHDFSLLPVANGVDDGAGHVSPGLHYDNLFYSNGSPQTATDYPFHGGLFDIYGLVFTLDNGDSVNLWSNGVTPGGLTYGIAVTDGTNLLDYTGGVSLSVVPLPSSAPMFGAALLGLGAVGYGLRRKKGSAAV